MRGGGGWLDLARVVCYTCLVNPKFFLFAFELDESFVI